MDLRTNTEQLQIICRSHYLLMELYLKKINRKMTKADIHSFRITCKKLKAYFSMLKDCAQTERPLKLSGKIADAYHLLGDIRDMQLQMHRIKHTAGGKAENEKPVKKLQKEIKKIKQQFRCLLSARMLSKNMQKNLQHLPAMVEPSAVEAYLSEKYTAIETLARLKEFSDKQIHSIRKTLKELYYNEALLHNHVHILPGNGLMQMRNADALLEQLGHYQDLCRAINLNNSKEFHFSEATTRNWIKEKHVCKNKITRQIKTAFTKETLADVLLN